MPRQIENIWRNKSAILAVLSGLLVGFSYPPFNLSFLSWFALIPLLMLEGTSRKSLFGWAFLSGFIANLCIYWWIVPVFNVAHQPISITVISLGALAAVLALYFAAFKVADDFISDLAWKPFYLATVWVVLEWIRSWVLTGFPWALLGHTQYRWISLIQVASITGVEGVSFMIVLVQSWLVVLFRRKWNFQAADVVVPLLLLSLVGFGHFRVQSQTKDVQSQDLRVAILQGNIDQYQKWDDRYESDIRTRYRSLALQADKLNPDVIIWPETAVPGWIPNDPFYTSWVISIATETNTPQLVGAVSRNNDDEFNAAFLFSSHGAMLGQYAKQHLVPFGEYVPFEAVLSKVTPYLGQLGRFASGKGPILFPVRDLQLSPLVCYEMVFSGLVRRAVRKGADVIVNITNDGWYLTTGAPLQHFITNIFRAVETRKPVIRAANTGISGVIDPWGRIIKRTNLMERTFAVVDVPLYKDAAPTIFVRWGNWFVWLCLFFLVTILLACPANSKKKLKN